LILFDYKKNLTLAIDVTVLVVKKTKLTSKGQKASAL